MDAVLFDNDGTLVDTHDLILLSYRYALKTVLGLELPEKQILAKVGQPLTVQMWDFTDDPALHDELMEVYRRHNHRIHDKMIQLFPGVAEMLQTLTERGFSLGVVTSKRHELAQHGLDILGVGRYFSVLIGADDCPSYKPDPEPVRLGCERLGVAPARCFYVGDSPFDIAAGNGAGCETVAALWGMFEPEALAPQHPDYECVHPLDLLTIPGLDRKADDE